MRLLPHGEPIRIKPCESPVTTGFAGPGTSGWQPGWQLAGCHPRLTTHGSHAVASKRPPDRRRRLKDHLQGPAPSGLCRFKQSPRY